MLYLPACLSIGHARSSERLAATVAVAALLSVGGGAVRAADAPIAAIGPEPSNQEMLRRMRAMEQRIQVLEQQLQQKNAAAVARKFPGCARCT
jgi:hypothetical protein